MKPERCLGLCAVAIGALLCVGCGKESAAPAGVAAPPAVAAATPVSVTAVRAQQRDVDVFLEATGTVTALNTVDIRAQVSSSITGVHVREGEFVRPGQLLFTLDARADEVNLAKARAQLAKDTALLAEAQRQLQRSRELLAEQFVSQGAVQTNQAAVESQMAVVAADRALIEAAQVALSYSRLRAPAAGRAGAINVFVGSTVQPGGSALVTLTQLDPIAVSFSLPQRDLGDALGTLRSGGGVVSAVLPEGRGTLTGKLHFVDSLVDPNSGTILVKAQFNNRAEALWPGAFVRIRMATRTLKSAVVVPQASVIQGPRGSIVYLIDADNKAVSKPVEVRYSVGSDVVVSGVAAGDRVVLDGRQNLRPGVQVVERPPEPSAVASRPASGSAPGASSAVAP